METCVLAFGGC